MAVGRFKGGPQSEKLVKCKAQRIHVAPRIALSLEAFGGHVAQSADDVARLGQVFRVAGLGQSEVGHPDIAPRIQQQVRRLDVAVQDSLTIGILQRLADLEADAGDTQEKRPIPIGKGERSARRPRQTARQGATSDVDTAR